MGKAKRSRRTQAKRKRLRREKRLVKMGDESVVKATLGHLVKTLEDENHETEN